MGSDICVRRLTKELKDLKKSPIENPTITVAPNESNILEMHYVIEGSPDTPYDGGVYHGKLIFPREYPLKPPSVIMITPSGRFVPNRRLCLSMSDFHPESWNPVWSVGTYIRQEKLETVWLCFSRHPFAPSISRALQRQY